MKLLIFFSIILSTTLVDTLLLENSNLVKITEDFTESSIIGNNTKLNRTYFIEEDYVICDN